jgi:ketosteroid isomerase-like protein
MALDDDMRSYYNAYNSENADAVANLLADDVVLTSMAGTQNGKAAYLATYRYMIGLFIDRMEPLQITVAADVATVHIRDTLTARADIADFMGQKLVAGQTLILELTGRYSFVSGKISRIEISPAN